MGGASKLQNLATCRQPFFYFITVARKQVFGFFHKIKKPCGSKVFHFGGEKGIRTPGPVTVNGFQDRRIRPLCHLSGAKV